MVHPRISCIIKLTILTSTLNITANALDKGIMSNFIHK
jgi:hypothetical protein